MSFDTYMLRCADDSSYVGHTDDLETRIAQYHAGEHPGYTRHRRSVTVVWSQDFSTREEALIHTDWKAIQQHAWGTRNPFPAHIT